MKKPTLTESFTVACPCGFSVTKAYKHEAAQSLINHIRKRHPRYMQQLWGKARKHAQGQNGCGYFDSGTSAKSDGWFQAQARFRAAHLRSALLYDIGSHPN